MDDTCARAVREVFVTLYEKGLIYQGQRITNWCPHCHTALSDIEVDHSDVQGHLWYIKYPVVGEDDYIMIATTRPETIMGDTAVAVNPADDRMKKYIARKSSFLSSTAKSKSSPTITSISASVRAPSRLRRSRPERL